MDLNRRAMLLGTVAGSAAVALSFAGCKSGCGRPAPVPVDVQRRTDGAPLSFSGAQARALDAALEQLLPATPPLPGAREAGVAGYVDRALRAPHFRDLSRLIARGLSELDRAAQKEAGRPFADLEPAGQGRLLARFQRGQADVPGFASGRFFAVLLALALEGYLGDPAHGGNAGGVVWRAIGFDAYGAHGSQGPGGAP
jgi:gluconate 2-dehydrogenase gamma chain